MRLVRKHKVTGVIEDRRPGRPHPDYVYGFMDQSNTFNEGEPFPKGKSSPAPVTQSTREDSLGEVKKIIDKEVKSRLDKATKAAMDAFQKALT